MVWCTWKHSIVMTGMCSLSVNSPIPLILPNQVKTLAKACKTIVCIQASMVPCLCAQPDILTFNRVFIIGLWGLTRSFNIYIILTIHILVFFQYILSLMIFHLIIQICIYVKFSTITPRNLSIRYFKSEKIGWSLDIRSWKAHPFLY